MNAKRKHTGLVLFLFAVVTIGIACTSTKPVGSMKAETKLVDVDSGWAANSINTTVFRKNSLISFGNDQYISFYDKNGFVMIGKRRLGDARWILQKTGFKGNVADAHNVISIMVDGDGYLHMAWGHHNNPLHYARSKEPASLELTEPIKMTGMNEGKVSYPEFYRLPNGNLLFFYRDGGSGNGNLVINLYNTKVKQWTVLQPNLVDGEGKRNAYWQTCVDANGTIHISWVWRESPDVASNHDLCYARSKDGGITWEKTTGERYSLPITASSAELAFAIPQKSELINQTSMVADGAGNPYIATYWREQGSTVPQYHLVYHNGNWHSQNLGFRTTAFSLSGAGTKRIPCSRPQVIAWKSSNGLAAAVIFRDEERANKVSVAVNRDLAKNVWALNDLTPTGVGQWEPTYDTELWKAKQQFHLFVQHVEQADAEGKSSFPQQVVQVLEWQPALK